MMNRIVFTLSMIIFFACGEQSNQSTSGAAKKVDKVALKSELDEIEKELQSNTSTMINKTKANLLIEKSIQYIDAFPKDELSGGYLFRAGEVCVGIKEYKKAIDLWERMKSDYSTHKRAPIALFLQGFTCDNEMREIEGAKKYYNEFLLQYPDHEYVGQVKELLKNIDISPEELVKSFQKKRESGE